MFGAAFVAEATPPLGPVGTCTGCRPACAGAATKAVRHITATNSTDLRNIAFSCKEKIESNQSVEGEKETFLFLRRLLVTPFTKHIAVAARNEQKSRAGNCFPARLQHLTNTSALLVAQSAQTATVRIAPDSGPVQL
jgi:hypothetical protein